MFGFGLPIMALFRTLLSGSHWTL